MCRVTESANMVSNVVRDFLERNQNNMLTTDLCQVFQYQIDAALFRLIKAIRGVKDEKDD